MGESNVDWLQEHMREHMTNICATDSADNVLNFHRPPYSSKNPGATALDLVYQAVELIGDLDRYATEKQARAESLAAQAIEKLKIADDRVRSAELARLAAETKMKECSDREKELNIRVQEIEEGMERTASGLAATEAQLAAAEQRAKAAEIYANQAGNALKDIEEALRAKLFSNKTVELSRRVVKAA